MLVKHNLYIKPEFQNPSLYSEETLWSIEKGHMLIENLIGYAAGFVKEELEPMSEEKAYYFGFEGSYTNELQIYRGSYRKPINKGNYHYVEVTVIDSTPHIQSWTNSNVVMKRAFITEGEPDIVVPNKKDFSEDKQAYYPPEGDYKEIEPVRG